MRLNPFKKALKNPKTLFPGSYHRVERWGVWVSSTIHYHLRDFAEQRSRSIPVFVDDMITEVVPLLPEWIPSRYRDIFIEERESANEGFKLVRVSESAMTRIDGYAKDMGITLGQALDELVTLFVVLVRTKPFRKQVESQRRGKKHLSLDDMIRLYESLPDEPESSDDE